MTKLSPSGLVSVTFPERSGAALNYDKMRQSHNALETGVALLIDCIGGTTSMLYDAVRYIIETSGYPGRWKDERIAGLKAATFGPMPELSPAKVSSTTLPNGSKHGEIQTLPLHMPDNDSL